MELNNHETVASLRNSGMTESAIKKHFWGMRDSGQVKYFQNYTLAEYEDRGLRLNPLAEKISKVFPQHFTLYDYKGSIVTDTLGVKSVLDVFGQEDLSIEGDILNVSDDLLILNLEKPQETQTSKLNASNSVSVPRELSFKDSLDKPSLGVDNIAQIMVEVIQKHFRATGTFIGIFGKWGRGKSYLFDRFASLLKEEENPVVRFSAWKYQDNKSSWAHLYNTIYDSYNPPPIMSFQNKFPNIRSIYDFLKNAFNWQKKIFLLNMVRHGIQNLLRDILILCLLFFWVFFVDKFKVVSLVFELAGVMLTVKIFLYAVYTKSTSYKMLTHFYSPTTLSPYLGFQAEIQKELVSLLKTWVPNSEGNKKIVLFVDDIDRCPMDQVVPIIDGLKIILDDPQITSRLIIFISVDQEVLSKGLAKKYGIKNNLLSERWLSLEYVEKVFSLGVNLSPIDKIDCGEILSRILPKSDAPSEDNVIGNGRIVGGGSFIVPNDGIVEAEEIKLLKNHGEVSEAEKSILQQLVPELDRPTPRRIINFYTKYIFVKRLIFKKVVNNGLGRLWSDNVDDRIVAEYLVWICNLRPIDKFDIRMPEILNKIIREAIICANPILNLYDGNNAK